MLQQNRTLTILNLLLLFGSCIIVVAYFFLMRDPGLTPRILGVTRLTAGLSGFYILYLGLLYALRKRIWLVGGSLIGVGIIGVNISLLVLTTGGFTSPYYALWLLVILAVSLFGKRYTFALTLITTIYYLSASWAAPDVLNYGWNYLVYLLAAYFAAGLGYWLHHVEASHTQAHDVSRLSQKLTQEQIKSSLLLRSIGDGVIVIDMNERIQLLNPAAEVLTGWKESEARGIDYRLVLPLSSDAEDKSVTKEQNPFTAAFQSKKSVVSDDLVLTNRNSKKIQLSLIVSPITSDEGSISGGIAVFRDISQEKSAERQRDEFISTASHEMRTPVAAIEGYLALALNPKVSEINNTAREYLMKAHDATQHLGKLFQDLLSTTKLEEGRIPNHPKPIELTSMINEIINELTFKAQAKNLGLNLQLPEAAGESKNVQPLYYVFADPERIHEVMVNLIDNAIKYTEQGGISISINGDDRQVSVGIHDTGMGISADDLKHLFQKFYRIDNSKTRQIGGTGLGLYICRKIIELYNGRIWVKSEAGQGSTFNFSLPRLTAPQVQEIETNPKSKVMRTQAVLDEPVAKLTPVELVASELKQR